MTDTKSRTPAPKKKKNKFDPGKPPGEAVGSSSRPAAVDRPGFDLGGSTGKTHAGTGLGPGTDAAENREDRSLRGRQKKPT